MGIFGRFLSRRRTAQPPPSPEILASHPAVVLGQQVLGGELSLDHAFAVARERGERHGIGPATDVSELIKQGAVAGHAREAVVMQQLLIEQLTAARPRLAETEYTNTALWVLADWVDIVTAALQPYGDALLYESAVRSGGQAAEYARRRGRPDLEGMVYHRLGALHLDTYSHGGGGVGEYWGRHREWLDKARHSDDLDTVMAIAGRVLLDERHDDEQANRSDEQRDDYLDGELDDSQEPTGRLRFTDAEHEMPPVSRAFELAADYFGRAARLRPDPWRGYSMKALAQTLCTQQLLGLAPITNQQVADSCHEALRHLSADAIEDRMFLLAVLQGQGQTSPAAAVDVETLLSGGLDDLVRRYGEIGAWDAVSHAVTLVSADDPMTAARLLDLQRTLTEAWKDEERRTRHLLERLQLTARRQSPAWMRRLTPEGLDAALQRVRADRSLSPKERGYAYVIAARLAASVDRESLALDLVETAVTLLNPIPDDQLDCFRLFYAALHIGEAVNDVRASNPIDAAAAYCSAIAYLLDAGSSDRALELLRRIELLVQDAPANAALMIPSLADVALPLEAAAGKVATRRLQDLYRHFAALMFDQGTNADVLLILVQLAKGAARTWLMRNGFKAVLLQGPDPTVLPRPQELLSHPWDDEYFDQDERLLAYASGRERRPLDTEHDRAANQRARFSDDVWLALLRAVTGAGDTAVRLPDELRAELQADTVLLVHWPTMNMELTQVIVTLLVTRERAEVVVRSDELPAATYSMKDGERTLVLPPESLFLAELRQLLRRDPRPRMVRPECVEPLSNMLQDMFQPLLLHMDELKAAGKTHVMISPYGPYRFFPLHLAGDPGHPVCADFSVSYLSDLGGLSRQPASATRRRPLAAFGLTYGDRDDLPALGRTEEELGGVCRPFSVQPVIDARATKAELLAALSSARRVHLRAHGAHDIDAPMLQTVYLTPSSTDDGRLFAYEVLSLDLSGLELVTLSACETGLGRFDEADNVAGLAANLLLTGSANVVSTLWPAAERASTTFFPILYQELARGARVRDAFDQAQRETRRLFPEYRDWGTFVLYEG
jgi:CHAT domain-containing protein